jgi:hypothetical protein
MSFDALLLVFSFLESWTNSIQLSTKENLTNRYDFGILELSILTSVTCQVSDNIYDERLLPWINTNINMNAILYIRHVRV